MAVLPIRIAPDPVLREKGKRVRNIDGSVNRLVGDMIETLHAAKGVGLAAPQVGVSRRVIVIHLPEQEVITLINPQVVRRKGERVVNEGCLSVPGYVGEITRSEAVTVKGRNREGQEIRIKAEKLLAQALEHEIDHINGILFVDHLESLDMLRKVEPADKTEESEQ